MNFGTEQLAHLVARKIGRPDWHAVRRRVARERAIAAATALFR